MKEYDFHLESTGSSYKYRLPFTDLNPTTEIYRELLDVISLVPFAYCVSASRLQMFGSHIQQHIVVRGVEPPMFTTGAERAFGKATMAVKFPSNARIIKSIDPRSCYWGKPRKGGAVGECCR